MTPNPTRPGEPQTFEELIQGIISEEDKARRRVYAGFIRAELARVQGELKRYKETVAVLEDTDLVKQLIAAQSDLKEGRVYSLEEVEQRLSMAQPISGTFSLSSPDVEIAEMRRKLEAVREWAEKLKRSTAGDPRPAMQAAILIADELLAILGAEPKERT